MMEEAGICEATADKVPNNADDQAYNQVINKLKETMNARVVICFCEGMTVRGLLRASQRKNVAGHFLFIGRYSGGFVSNIIYFVSFKEKVSNFQSFVYTVRTFAFRLTNWFK